jgi:hypothetical protein
LAFGLAHKYKARLGELYALKKRRMLMQHTGTNDFLKIKLKKG